MKKVIPYQPTASEMAVIESVKGRQTERPQPPRLKIVSMSTGNVNVAVDHPDPGTGYRLLMGALGISSETFCQSILNQICDFATYPAEGEDGELEHKVSESTLNAMIAVVCSVQPRDEIESMLALQMSLVHQANIQAGKRLLKAEELDRYDCAQKAFTKTSRTFTQQIDTLKRYREGGQQRITVQHVNVADGGKAVVGNVTPGAGRGSPE